MSYLDIRNNRLIRVLDSSYSLDSVVLSRDCRWAWLKGKELELWDIETGQVIRGFPCGKQFAVTPDSRFLADAVGGTMHVWETHSGRTVIETDIGPNVSSVAWLADGSHIATKGREDGAITIWRVEWDLAQPSPYQWKEDAKGIFTEFLNSLEASQISLSESSSDEGSKTWAEGGSDLLRVFTQDNAEGLRKGLNSWGYGNIPSSDLVSF